jgi:hypothetical protein
MNFLAKIIISSFLLLISFGSFAENWVRALDIFTRTLYIDKDSAKRSGDLATITTKLDDDPPQKNTYDCVRKMTPNGLGVFEPIGSYGKENKKIEVLLMEAACKRPWEVWK